jgi:hypothetical protein
MTFKLGDVIRYGISKNVEAIVSRDHDKDIGVCAWRAVGSRQWQTPMVIECPKLDHRLCEPHPDADRVLAEYTAWRLGE